ncbi:MAG TPA: YggS family pyridoxal phosphate-dependent enzyme [Ignavibacteria bacterium]|nr:YggS family pyridoxal phosphate-dependent enzyme [Ignavibacteria bacterium]
MDNNYIISNYKELCEDISDKLKEINRSEDEITLVAVSKTFPSGDVHRLFGEGHSVFGENKVQEMVKKYEELPDDNIQWHLIGHLQTNKVKYITGFVTMIQSVDSEKLALEIDRHAAQDKRRIDVLVQVNTSEEEQKSGISASDAPALMKKISGMENLRLSGLMTIGMFTDDEDIIRQDFRILKSLFDEYKPVYNDFKFLSMGMTSDYRIALEEGSNMLRIGSAIFGKRNYNLKK